MSEIKLDELDYHFHLRSRNNNEWEGKYFEEKEVSVYYKMISQEVILLTVKARYGKNFPRSGKQ